MNMPGFNAAASLQRVVVPYRMAWSSKQSRNTIRPQLGTCNQQCLEICRQDCLELGLGAKCLQACLKECSPAGVAP
jgi:hypothetical protein